MRRAEVPFVRVAFELCREPGQRAREQGGARCGTQGGGLSRNRWPVSTEAVPQALGVEAQVGHTRSRGEGWVVGGPVGGIRVGAHRVPGSHSFSPGEATILFQHFRINPFSEGRLITVSGTLFHKPRLPQTATGG